jgi:N6-L-threonylcarbamoyladenine synthase
MAENTVYVLGIESSCDETAAAVSAGDLVLSNVIAAQDVHARYGGVVPELASRAHQKNIVPVVDEALKTAGIGKERLHAVAYTAGPGLIGSLLVGSAFARAFARALGLPLVPVNHLQAHVAALFARRPEPAGENASGAPACPAFPFLCLTVSGGHTQIVRARSLTDLTVIGQTQDDAAGEAFDKTAKLLGLPYPGGPAMDKLARGGDPNAFRFPHPRMPGLDYSFSGLKTSVLYFVQDAAARDPQFVEKNKASLCASVQQAIVSALMEKLVRAAEETGIGEVALSGGVSANSALRAALAREGHRRGWNTYVPPPAFCTDNAAMIAVSGYYRLREGFGTEYGEAPYARSTNL